MEKKEIVSKKSLIDFALAGGLGKATFENALDLERAGAIAIKTFMIPRFPELSYLDTETLRKIMEKVSETSLPLLVHAEDHGAAPGAELKKPIDWGEKVPSRIESVAVAKVCELARQLDTRTHLVHLTAKETVDIIRTYKRWGSKVSGETAPKYMTYTLERLRDRGPYAKTDPPLRSKEDTQAMKEALGDRTLEIIASDHAPYLKEEKEKGWENIGSAPAGAPEVEVTLPFMVDLFLKGEIRLETLLETLCVNPAKLLGVYPEKGTLQIGTDADFVLLDPKKEFEIKSENLMTKTGESIFLGEKFAAAPVATFSRGDLVIENHESIGKAGRGRFLTRSNE